METFTPWSALAGGVLIGASATLLLWTTGRIAGISGIARGLLSNGISEFVWRALFIVGLIAGAWLFYAFAGPAAQVAAVPHARAGFPPLLLVAAGLAVGYGTALARGCTSGHGVCGLARLSPRSAAATATFVAAGIATTWVVRHAIGVS
ncbi:hypothetical protein C7405_116105 [Paraburkholderia caballeronis]|uniref:YeeE/YedE family protein n=1 Tax=Paraburkholderia caballeronis TaxID=416943 RepID=UPI00106532E5|nr:YeeE/YedE thiosulfate transporter family protein [Paraburkholderia caballeronis]TDV27825.1 hypothetical protein C7405_116105 [Paraburkholderia caballeronis]